MSQLAPSILAADFGNLAKQITQLENNNITYLHIDVMDGMFVPSISFGMPVMASLRGQTKMLFDTHLMIEEPIRYIDEFCKAGADSITVHAEACEDLAKTLQCIRDHGVKVAVSICPETEVSAIASVLDQVDMVLIMSVHPGFGGQKIIPETLDKVDELIAIRKEQDLSFLIQIDGGVNKDNIEEIKRRGVDVIVAGTAVFKGDISENIAALKGETKNAS